MVAVRSSYPTVVEGLRGGRVATVFIFNLKAIDEEVTRRQVVPMLR